MGIDISTAAKILSSPLGLIFKRSSEVLQKKLKFWANDSAMQSLVRKVEAYENVKTLWQPGKEVKLSTFYYPLRIEFLFDSFEKQNVGSLKDIPNKQNYVIEGAVGQGKSIFLRWLCVMELSSMGSGRIPIFVELRKIRKEYSLRRAVFEAFQTLGFTINQEFFQCYAESGAFVLLLDGFDELGSHYVRPVLDQLQVWSQRFSDLQIIVSSRPYGEIQKSEHFRVIKLVHIEPADHVGFYKKIGVVEPMLSGVVNAISNSQCDAAGLLKTPLLLTLVWWVYQAHQTIPDNLSEFYVRLFDTVVFRNDATKPGFRRVYKTRLHADQLEELFSAFCFYVLRFSYGISLDSSEFKKCFNSAASYIDVCCSREDFLHDATKLLCLMQEDGGKISFIHKSLPEYHSASFVSKLSDVSVSVFYRKARNDMSFLHKWRYPLVFLRDIDEQRFEAKILKQCMQFLVAYIKKHQPYKNTGTWLFCLLWIALALPKKAGCRDKTSRQEFLEAKRSQLSSVLINHVILVNIKIIDYIEHMARYVNVEFSSSVKYDFTLNMLADRANKRLQRTTHPAIVDCISEEMGGFIANLNFDFANIKKNIQTRERREKFVIDL